MIGLLLGAALSTGCDGGDAQDAAEGGDADPVCVGVTPPEGSADQPASPLRALDEHGVASDPPRQGPIEPGEPAPPWTLPDFQPQSCGLGSTYGMDSFQGRVTVVALLAAW